MTVLQALSQAFPAERLKTALVDRVAYANDAGFYHLLPQAVVQPINEAEVQQLFCISGKFLTPLVFRAGGTSLSGQSITDGILVDIGRYWRKARVLDNGKKVRVQPGIIGGQVNGLLLPYGSKIGPDPASIHAAMMGGILSNNASGMCCGVVHNAYHTLDRIRFVLPDGKVYDTGIAADYDRFLEEQPTISDTCNKLRNELIINDKLLEKVREKYRMKNTVGYGLNALADYRHPLDIFAHLLIGAEGTLAFISEAELITLPDLPFKSAAMLYFPGIYEACSAIGPLKASGAEALELMDRQALASVAHLPGLPVFFNHLPAGAAALLCEYQASDKEMLQQLLLQAQDVCSQLPLLHPAVFTTDEATRNFYWKIRKGMFPSVGAVRKRGTTVILEDVAFPVARLADAVTDLQALFAAHGYAHAIIFGHAREGNIHFVITQLLDTETEIARYDRFMRAVVDLVVHKYNGSLKAEHGTGRNMAPFVATEWGGEAYQMMLAIKQAADPLGLLNPGVIINPDPEAHIRHLKQMPQVEAEVDRCIECGFCEHHCPSKDVTLTPRQRIQVRRQLKQWQDAGNQKAYNELAKAYQYAGLDTCATDGLCQLDCPVGINTGELVKRLRQEQHGTFALKMAGYLSAHFHMAEGLVKTALKTGVWLNRLLGKNFMWRLTGGLQKVVPALPRWWPELTAPPRWKPTAATGAQAVYLSACIQRMMGGQPNGAGIQEVMQRVCGRSGIRLYVPEAMTGHCCGQAFGSKGYPQAAAYRQAALIDALWEWTDAGRLPVVMDFTSCTYTLLQHSSHLPSAAAERLTRLNIYDAAAFLEKWVAPALQVSHPKARVVLHPGCAAAKLQQVPVMQKLASRFSREVVIPASSGCCGMAGDRGFLFPELTQSATLDALAEAGLQPADGYYGNAKTCEMALTHFSGNNYRHLVYLLDEASA